MKRIRIDAGVIVAYQQGEHRILISGTVLIEGGSVRYVGRRRDLPADEIVDARTKLVTPGFINAHTHLTESPLDASFVEDVGSRAFHMSKLVDVLPAKWAALDEGAARACVEFSMAELIRTGTTTVMEIGSMGRYVADAAERAGLRAYIADGYRSARWYTDDGSSVKYAWDEPAGLEGFRAAVRLVEELDGRAGGRIRGFLSPMQVDTSSAELLRLSRAASDDLEVPLALHVSQAVFEFDEMVRRHGVTPIEWLEEVGFLSERCILGHAILPAGHSWTPFPGDDVRILADHRVSVAHAAWVFARSGIAMESFPRYLDAGVNVCLATDSAPQSMIEAMRWAAILGKITMRDARRGNAREAFDAATLRGARALQRDDLGRIAAGAKADLLVWNLESMSMTPHRDPIRNLVFGAQTDDLEAVMVDGAWLMRGGTVTTVDERRVARDLQEAAERVWAAMGPGDWAGRGIDQLSPPTYAPYDDTLDGPADGRPPEPGEA